MKRGFTLIELLAVIIILGIIALITIPLVVRMINDSREKSAVRSAENYVAGVKKAVLKTTENSRFTAEYCEVRDDGTGALDCDNGTVLEVEVEGNKPTSGIIYFNTGDVTHANNLKFGKYTISSTEDGEFTINSEPKEESYKKQNLLEEDVPDNEADYKKGEVIYVHDIPFYVLTNSSRNQNYVVAIKRKPLMVDELNNYGNGIVNRLKGNSAQTGYRWCRSDESNPDCNTNDKIGLMAFYNNNDCGYIGDEKFNNGCTNQYKNSDVKKVVDNWASQVFNGSDLKQVKGYKARIITYDELANYLHYDYNNTNNDYFKNKTIAAPEAYHWIYGQFTYWTMTPFEDYNDRIWFVADDHLIGLTVNEEGTVGAVRPVINVYKNVIRR